MSPNAEQADEFERQVTAWKRRLGLNDWRVHMSPKRAQACMAQVDAFDLSQRSVQCRLGLAWRKSDLTPNGIERIAAHEMLHVLLYELIDAAKANSANGATVESVEHRVINTLVPLLVPEVE